MEKIMLELMEKKADPRCIRFYYSLEEAIQRYVQETGLTWSAAVNLLVKRGLQSQQN